MSLAGSFVWLRLEHIPLSLGMLRPLIGAAILAMLLIAIAEARNWARIGLLILTTYGLVMAVFSIVLNARRMPLLVGTDVVVLIATLYSLALLFKRDSNSWFRTRGHSSEMANADV